METSVIFSLSYKVMSRIYSVNKMLIMLTNFIMLIENFLCIILHRRVSFYSYSQLAFCSHCIFNSLLCNLN